MGSGELLWDGALFITFSSPDAVCSLNLVFNFRAPFVPAAFYRSFADISLSLQSLVLYRQYGSHTRSVVLHGFPPFLAG